MTWGQGKKRKGEVTIRKKKKNKLFLRKAESSHLCRPNAPYNRIIKISELTRGN